MKAPLLSLLILAAVGAVAGARDSDAPPPAVRHEVLAPSVRLAVLHLTHGEGKRVQSVQLPVVVAEAKRKAEVRMEDRLYTFTTLVPDRPGQLRIRLVLALNSAIQGRGKTLVDREAALLPGRMNLVISGREEFRIFATPVTLRSEGARF